MTKLKLGPLVEERPVKITIELPAATYRDLTRYAEILAAETEESAGSIEPSKLIAPMIARFMATDRAFLKLRRTEDQNHAPLHSRGRPPRRTSE